jgi:hypothetical protein
MAAAAVRPRAAGESLEGSREASMALSMWLSAETWAAVLESAGAMAGRETGARRAAAGVGGGGVSKENWWVALTKAMPKARERLAEAQAM